MPEVRVLEKILISIVDDDESVREATKGLMKSLGFTAETFPSAADFLTSHHRRRTACLIADVNMPGMTGPELHRRLIASGDTIPTILITAYPDDNVRARALSAGAICYLRKPFDEGDLLVCVRSAVAGAKAGEAGGNAS
jgi:FixJ family two-component response regulator